MQSQHTVVVREKHEQIYPLSSCACTKSVKMFYSFWVGRDRSIIAHHFTLSLSFTFCSTRFRNHFSGYRFSSPHSHCRFACAVHCNKDEWEKVGTKENRTKENTNCCQKFSLLFAFSRRRSVGFYSRSMWCDSNFSTFFLHRLDIIGVVFIVSLSFSLSHEMCSTTISPHMQY